MPARWKAVGVMGVDVGTWDGAALGAFDGGVL
jgi:hypothetical protein